MRDLLAGAAWECTDVDPGAASAEAPGLGWRVATVPGTAVPDRPDRPPAWVDDRDWWYRSTLPRLAEPGTLVFDGLATVADVWVDGEHVLHSENMFRRHRVALPAGGERGLVIRFAALTSRLADLRRPRPRWRCTQVRDQALRHVRTTITGRSPEAVIAPPVGPWRAVRLVPADVNIDRLAGRLLDSGDGLVEVALTAPAEIGSAVLVVGSGSDAVEARLGQDGAVLSGSVPVPAPQLWWPHTHGSPTTYPVAVRLDGREVPLGRVGFRRITADRRDGGFALSVNGVPVFARGAVWVPPELTGQQPDHRRVLGRLVRAGMNMLRVPGGTAYGSDDFLDACDELGVLVWQDCMLAGMDYPDTDRFRADLLAEVDDQARRLARHPSLAVICGGSEVEQQPAMLGLSADEYALPAVRQWLPELVAAALPGIPFVTSSPTGGPLPFSVGTGVAQYFGVGAYLRPLCDVRSAGVRFAAECLAFSIPPERRTVDDAFGSARRAGHHPSWKAGVPRDPQASWDFEDVRDHYVRDLFGVDPLAVRIAEPDRYLDLGSAAVAVAMDDVLRHWRRPGSRCAGGLVLCAQDLVPGAGWGLLDAAGRPKAPLYALGRILAPVAVFVTDDGLDGLTIHLVNDSPDDLDGELAVALFSPQAHRRELPSRQLTLPARAAVSVALETMSGRFLDANGAYRFGPPAVDVVTAEFRAGDLLATDVHFALGARRPVLPDLGLTARLVTTPDGPAVEVATRLAAQFVALDVTGHAPADSWFHLAPGQRRTVRLAPEVGDTDAPAPAPAGTVRALNCLAETTISRS